MDWFVWSNSKHLFVYLVLSINTGPHSLFWLRMHRSLFLDNWSVIFLYLNGKRILLYFSQAFWVLFLKMISSFLVCAICPSKFLVKLFRLYEYCIVVNSSMVWWSSAYHNAVYSFVDNWFDEKFCKVFLIYWVFDSIVLAFCCLCKLDSFFWCWPLDTLNLLFKAAFSWWNTAFKMIKF